MVQHQRKESRYLVLRQDDPLIFIPGDEHGEEVTYVFASEEEADARVSQGDMRRALAAIGSWSDLDWDDMVRQLNQIRHASPPTPPIDDL